jgi:hypothetical protein
MKNFSIFYFNHLSKIAVIKLSSHSWGKPLVLSLPKIVDLLPSVKYLLRMDNKADSKPAAHLGELGRDD